MSDKLPVVGRKEFVQFLEDHGFKYDRQRGSHVILTKKGVGRPIVVPDTKELRTTVIMRDLKTANITRKTFIEAMRKKK